MLAALGSATALGLLLDALLPEFARSPAPASLGDGAQTASLVVLGLLAAASLLRLGPRSLLAAALGTGAGHGPGASEEAVPGRGSGP